MGTESKGKTFDLNIEKILDNWEVYHAIREIIANALDEQILTSTRDIEIVKEKDIWHIIDYGRGLNHRHLTQNENEEKQKTDKLIGRFGVGLKDALATLYRRGVGVKISSKYGTITLTQASKAGFDDVITLQAEIFPPENENMVGTDFCLTGCADDDIEKAKKLFFKFSDRKVLESTAYGDIIEKRGDIADIYINGVKVATEDNFLFSYNITVLNGKIKNSLNRERSNVGRTAYTDRVKDILKNSGSKAVEDLLVQDFYDKNSGGGHDELNWHDIEMLVTGRIAAGDKQVAFVTAKELEQNPDIVDEMKLSGMKPVCVSDNLADKMNTANATYSGNVTFNTVNKFRADEQKRFSPLTVEQDSLSEKEKAVFSKTDEIFALIGGKPRAVLSLNIAEKLYDYESGFETLGMWRPDEREILIRRDRLGNVKDYAATLLHECAHAISGEGDVSRRFESSLTEIIGILAEKLI